MIEHISIDEITPAEYNPRTISEREFSLLKDSLSELGLIIPIIVNHANNVIIAGHQRTRASAALRYAKIPIIRVKNISKGDEMKLNQLHNGIEKEPENSPKIDKMVLEEGFTSIEHSRFTVYDSTPTYVREICNLTIKYGNILSCVICDGEVIMGGNYVKACTLLGYDVNAYILNPNKKDAAIKYLCSDYGKYSYKKTERNTYIQGLAQLHRNPTRTDGKKAFKSRLYEDYVIPYLMNNRTNKVLDFGSGKGAYVNMLSGEFDILGLEFFNNNSSIIDADEGHRMIDELIAKIKEIGRFDVIVCDSVLNSVDSHEAEEHILACLNLLLKENGKLFVSGRSLKAMERDMLRKKDTTTGKRFIEFADERGLTSNHRRGRWYFQKFHSEYEIQKNLEKAGFEIELEKWVSRGFFIVANKKGALTSEQYVNAVNFEFDLPLPGGRSYGRQEDILKVLNIMNT